jgi:hypothetical protein
MSEAKKPAAMVEIHPGSPEWQAWLKHHRGTKTETRMLLCLGGKTKTGEIIPPRPWLARAKFPPDAPKPENVRRSVVKISPASKPVERASVPEGKIDEVAARLDAAAARNASDADQRRKRNKQIRHAEKTLDKALADVVERRVPYVNGRDDLGVHYVPDPHSANGEVRAKIVNLRDDPVGQMAQRGQLGDAAQTMSRLRAARLWQGFYERAEIGYASGIDPTAPVIDCGHLPMQDTDARLAAQDRLNQIRQALGIVGDRIVTWVLGDKYSLGKVLVLLGRVGRIEQKALGSRFRECLDTIAVELGISAEAKGARGPQRRRDVFDEAARYAWSPQLHRAILAAKSRP